MDEISDLEKLESLVKRSTTRSIPATELLAFQGEIDVCVRYFEAAIKVSGPSAPLGRFARKREVLRNFLILLLRYDVLDAHEVVVATRLSLGLSRSDFAKMASISTPTLSRIERGSASPTVKSYLRILQIGGFKLRIMPN